MNRIKAHIKGLTISSFLILLPMFVGLILWNKLPNKLPGHYNLYNEVDRYDPKWVIVFVLPLVMLAMHMFASILTLLSKKQDIPDKVLTVLFAICPLLSNVISYISYSTALNKSIPNVGAIIYVILGLIYMLLGNYLPKVQNNHVLGVRIKTTFESRMNWNYSNRLAGWCLVICGVLFLLAALVSGLTGNTIVLIIALVGGMAIVTFIPIMGSYCYYTKHKNDEGYFDVK